ncbi:DinB family protein [Paenibacillus sp. GCM10012306]|uniref:DinB family protein n=1 Tax=Paenibacillus sp. GCM10012306 TaxID=3317342 RepID=UPI00360F8658
MSTKNEVILGYGEWINFAKNLSKYEEQSWLTPLGPDKWTVKEVVGHIVLWDKYIHNEVTRAILHNSPLGLSNAEEIEEFNRKAGEWALSKTKDEILTDLISSREAVLEDLQAISEEAFTNVYNDVDGNPFVLKDFIVEMTRHDHHHRAQVERVL